MLQLNPYFRIAIDEALAHPFFSKIRKADKEVTAPNMINVKINQNGETLDRKRLRQQFLKEV
jgi:hypothetical protein